MAVSGRDKVKYHVTKILEHVQKIFEQLKAIDDLQAGQSEKLTNDIPKIIEIATVFENVILDWDKTL